MSENHEEEKREDDTSPKKQELREKLREWANSGPGASEGFTERVMEEGRKRPVPEVSDSEQLQREDAVDRLQAERKQGETKSNKRTL